MQLLRFLASLLVLLTASALVACGGGTGVSAGLPPSSLAYNTADATYQVCQPIVPNAPVLVGGESLFSVTPPLPGGLSLAPSSGLITGTPVEPSPQDFYIVTASNGAGQVSFPVSITVGFATPPSALTYATTEATYGLGFPIQPNVPSVNGAVDTWFVVPALPPGLSLDVNTGVITGTPSAVAAETTHTVTARNCVDQSTTTQLRIGVADPNSPPANLVYADPFPSYVGCEPIVPNEPQLDGFATGYAANTPLPAGLSLDPFTGVITGTPTDDSIDQEQFQITASNAAGTAVATVIITVTTPPAPSNLAYTPLAPTYAVGQPGPTLVPSVSGSPIGYSISPALPQGLTIDALTGVIGGTPTIVTPDTQFTVTAVDCVGQEVTATIGIEVADPALPPTNFSYSTPVANYVACEPIVPNLPIVSGLVELFTISPPLPLGLVFDPLSGAITGAASTTLSSPTVHTVTATNQAGQETATVTIDVDAPQTPANLDYPFDIVAYTLGTAIEPNVPSFDGEVTQWSAIPPLPAGLDLDPVTGAITGAPSVIADTTQHTISGSNCLGQEVSVVLTITVVDPSTFVPRYLYTINADETVSGLIVDSETGQLTHNGYELTGVDPVDLEVAPTGLKLYVLNAGDLNPGSSTVTLYNVEQPSGRLSKNASVVELPDGAFPTDMELTSNGDYLYVVNPSPANSISAFEVLGDGTLSELPGSPFASPAQNPVALAIDPLDRFLFVGTSAGGSSQVSAIVLDSDDGSLGAANSLTLTGASASCTSLISSSGQLTVHVATDAGGLGRLEAFAVDAFTGALTELVDLDLGSTPTRVRGATLGNQRLVYVCTTNRVERFVLNGAGTPLAPAPAVPYAVPAPSDIALTVDGSFAFVTLSSVDEISSAEVLAGTSGQLDAISPATAPTDRMRTRDEPRAVALAFGNQPIERVTSFVYTTNSSQGDVSQFEFNPGGPGLTAITPGQSSAGISPDGIAVHPFLDLAYVVDAFAGTPDDVFTFTIGTDGDLGPPGGTTDLEDAGVSGDGTLTVVIEPNGRFAFVVRSGAPTSQIIRYRITGATLDSPTAVNAGDQSRYPAVDPTGRFLYVPNQFSANVSQYRIDPATGDLTSLGTVPAGAAPWAVAIDATGRFAYVANRGSNDVSAYQIDSNTGALVSIGAAVPAGLAPTAIVAGPRGRTLFVANQFSGSITRFLVNLNPVDAFPDGSIGSVGTFNLPGQPRWLDLDAEGERMFCTLTNTGQVVTLSIDAAAGASLTLEDTDISAPGSGTLNVVSRDRVQ